jgi:hypothetical protein
MPWEVSSRAAVTIVLADKRSFDTSNEVLTGLVLAFSTMLSAL